MLKKVSRKPSINSDCADSQQPVNKPKNRVGTIVPCMKLKLFKNVNIYILYGSPDDATRVILKTVSALPGSNYINASRIDVSCCDTVYMELFKGNYNLWKTSLKKFLQFIFIDHHC